MEETDKGRAPDFKQLAEEWKGSGKSIKKFCQEKGIREQRFYYHKKRIEGRNPAGKSQVVRLSVLVREAARGGYEITRGGAMLRIPPGFDSDQVKTLLELLGK